ncbi:MAG: hypothetical protein Q9183_005956, partial [Haloplaca sp. 2 TL-2023]
SVTQQTPAAEPGSGQPLKFSHHRHSSTGKASKRPTSQPAGYANTHQPAQLIHQPRSSNTERWRDLEVARKYGELAQEATQRFKYGPAERKSQEFLDEQIRRAREETAAILSSSRKSPKFGHQAQPQPRLSVTTNPTNDRFRSDIESVEQVYNNNPRDIPPTTHSPFSPDSLRRSREEKKALKGPAPPDLSQPGKNSHVYTERRDEPHRQQYQPTSSNMSTNMTKSGSTNGVEHHVKVSDGNITQQPRHTLSLLLENGKRGRASPLPQAVQGAQARNSGPASDPGIKNEFGRMFSGIGGGVGSTGAMGSGTSTPFPSSPKVNHEPERRTPFTGRGELMDLTRSRERSTQGRRPLVPDRESRMDSENGNTAGVAGGSTSRGVKRKHHHHTH